MPHSSWTERAPGDEDGITIYTDFPFIAASPPGNEAMVVPFGIERICRVIADPVQEEPDDPVSCESEMTDR
jgi:hypothetical protein